MKMVVGLGNPGRRYKNTPHNLGWEVISFISKEKHIKLNKKKFQAKFGRGKIDKKEIILVQPTSFVNLTGFVVLNLKKYYKILLEDILIICDDFNLPVGRIRIRPQGSSGGHKGLGSIIDSLETNKFARLRLGIGPLPEEENPANFVLQPISSEVKKKVKDMIRLSAEAVYCWGKEGIKVAMNKYNAANLKR